MSQQFGIMPLGARQRMDRNIMRSQKKYDVDDWEARYKAGTDKFRAAEVAAMGQEDAFAKRMRDTQRKTLRGRVDGAMDSLARRIVGTTGSTRRDQIKRDGRSARASADYQEQQRRADVNAQHAQRREAPAAATGGNPVHGRPTDEDIRRRLSSPGNPFSGKARVRQLRNIERYMGGG